MPYRLLTEAEQESVEARIAGCRKKIEEHQKYIEQLEGDLERGAWYSDTDIFSLPLPKPHCYLCGHSSGNRNCLRGYTFGVVCAVYVHFTQKEKV